MRVRNPDGRIETLTADAFVVALGSYQPAAARARSALPCGVYPAKGFSITLDIGRTRRRCRDRPHAWKIVLTRLGDRLRVAGTAELSAGTPR